MRITEVNTVISTDFAGGMFNSCHDVEMPSNNQKALGVLCGDYAVSYHSDQKALGVLCGDYAVSYHSYQKALGIPCGDCGKLP